MRTFLGLCLGLVLTAVASITAGRAETAGPEAGRLVLAHYMVCCPRFGPDSTLAQYAIEYEAARGFDIDGFALNIGTWWGEAKYPQFTRRMFDAAVEAKSDIKLVFSMDGFTVDEAVAAMMEYKDHPNYLRVGGRPVITTYGQTGEWGRAVRAALKARGVEIFLVPFYKPGLRDIGARLEPLGAPVYTTRRAMAENPEIEGYFQFFGPLDKPPLVAASVREVIRLVRERGKLAMMGIAPYYRGLANNSRVFEFDGFELMQTQWLAAIEGGADWIEFVTWNDWGEATYVSPASPDTYNGRWGRILPHTAYLEASRYYIDWFRHGSPPAISQDRIFYFYRLHPKTASGYTELNEKGIGRPKGWEKLNDRLFFTAFLTASATLEVRIGQDSTTLELPAGVSNHSVPMALGAISWRMSRGGQEMAQGRLDEDITEDGRRGSFNYTSGALGLGR